jgi:AraC-like DNA-binding protein
MIDGRVVRQPPRNVRVYAGSNPMVFQCPGEHATKPHAHPAWSVVIPRAGHVTWTDQVSVGESAGAVLPPQVVYHAHITARHCCLFIDPWYLGLGPGQRRTIPLDLPTVDRVRALWFSDGTNDPDERARETVALLRLRGVLPSAVSIDQRVVAALRKLATANDIECVAASVGMSPSHLRALVLDQTGTRPAQLRLWQRLRTAILSLPDSTIAQAACDAGFADQAHFTRTASRLVGQTPGELVRVLSGSPHSRHLDSTPALVTAA